MVEDGHDRSSSDDEMVRPSHKHSDAALLIIDMVTDFRFRDGERLFESVYRKVGAIARLKERFKKAEAPVIYVNDNFGLWKNSFSRTLEAARSSELGEKVISKLLPDNDDYHVLKPQRSGFYATPLEVLLSELTVSTVVVTGVTTDICVLFTAHDAYMRGFKVWVPSDCSAAVEEGQHKEAIQLLERIADADVDPSSEIEIAALGRRSFAAKDG
jgi:nicotinamidase-related amidase